MGVVVSYRSVLESGSRDIGATTQLRPAPVAGCTQTDRAHEDYDRAVSRHETRFCTASDGVGLAYALDGAGPPLVKASNWMTHLDYERKSPVWRHWVRELSRGHTLVRYDERGCGLSDRQFDGTPTLETYVGDLTAVVDAAGLERFALLALSGRRTDRHRLRRPQPRAGERARPLRDVGARARLPRRGEAEKSRLLGELIRVGWGGAVPAFRQVFSSIYIPSAGEEQKRWYDDLQQVSSTGEMAARLWRSRSCTDVSGHAAPRHPARARPPRAAGRGGPVRGGAAPGGHAPGRPLRDARERQPRAPGG